MIFDYNGTKYKLDIKYNTYWRANQSGSKWVLMERNTQYASGGIPLVKRECVIHLLESVSPDGMWIKVCIAKPYPSILVPMEGRASVEERPGRKNDSWDKWKGRDLAMQRMMAPIGSSRTHVDIHEPCGSSSCKQPHRVEPIHPLPDKAMRRAVWQAYWAMQAPAQPKFYWRLLELGEKICEGDEVFSTSYCEWYPAGDFMFGEVFDRTMTHPYRRKEFYHGKK